MAKLAATLVASHIVVTLLLVVEFILLQAVAVGVTTVVYSFIPTVDASAQPNFDDWRRIFQVVSPTLTLSGGAGIVLSSILFHWQAQKERQRAEEVRAEAQAEVQAAQAAAQKAQMEVQSARAEARAEAQAEAQAEVQAARAEAQLVQARLEAAQANERAAQAEAELLRVRLSQLENGNANGQSAA